MPLIPPALPPEIIVIERGWLSANNVLLFDGDEATLVDSGYVTHAAQTVALLHAALEGRQLGRLVNTHSHSDHIGGNAAVQRALTEFGYGQLKPTGVIGADTHAAIQKFERDRKLPVTGQLSDRLIRDLTVLTGRPID